MRKMKKPILLAGLAALSASAYADFSDDFEGANVWTTSEGPGVLINPWFLQVGIGYSQSGSNNWFFQDVANISDSYLDSPSLIADQKAPTLSFGRQYFMEEFYDGVVVEVNVNGAGFEDVEIGGVFQINGYDGPISEDFESPIGGRDAFHGEHMGYLTSIVLMQSVMAGDSIILRFRGATDNSVPEEGFYLDDVLVTGVSVVPEPMPFVAVALGIACLATLRRRKYP